MSTLSSTIILRKRKRGQDDGLVLHLASSSSPENGVTSSESELSEPLASTSKLLQSPKRKKRYACPFEGCDKVYTKPSRLAEHERSHTGDRPFACVMCDKRYLRESHLQAHSRSHLPTSARPFACAEPGCEKRFWTAQHLQSHSEVHRGEKQYQCTHPECEEVFAKHHQLRDHLCTVHAPPGTKPYQCEHDGCTKSFSMNQHLRAHLRTHDEKRYTCIHVSCLSSQPYFATWSALQHHMRSVHPPSCPHPECNGKIFTAQKGLRAHMKIHEQRNVEAELQAALAEIAADSDNELPRKRRRGGEVGRDWVCAVSGCNKDFKSKKALTVHNKVTHLGLREFVCPHEDCDYAFGYKHLLQRHLTKQHSTAAEPPSNEQGADNQDTGEISDAFNIDDITGVSYDTRAKEMMQTSKHLQCPHPHLHGLLEPSASSSSMPGASRNCDYVFSRAYDLRRHLRAIHGVDIEKDRVENWVKAHRDSTPV